MGEMSTTPAEFQISTVIPRPEPKQERSREKYERLLDAAEELVAREGYDALTTTGVTQAAGLPPSAFYRWFNDKDDLASALLRRHNARLDEAIETVIRALDQPEWVEVASTVFATTIDYYRRHPSHHILWYEGRIGTAARREVHEHTARLGQALFDQAQRDGFAPPNATIDDVTLLIEIADRVVEVAFRDNANGDDSILERGFAMVAAALENFLQSPGD